MKPSARRKDADADMTAQAARTISFRPPFVHKLHRFSQGLADIARHCRKQRQRLLETCVEQDRQGGQAYDGCAAVRSMSNDQHNPAVDRAGI